MGHDLDSPPFLFDWSTSPQPVLHNWLRYVVYETVLLKYPWLFKSSVIVANVTSTNLHALHGDVYVLNGDEEYSINN